MPQERKTKALPKEPLQPSTMAELKALRLAQKAANRRVEELKMRLFRMTEQHMDQAVSLIRRWLKD